MSKREIVRAHAYVSVGIAHLQQQWLVAPLAPRPKLDASAVGRVARLMQLDRVHTAAIGRSRAPAHHARVLLKVLLSAALVVPNEDVHDVRTIAGKVRPFHHRAPFTGIQSGRKPNRCSGFISRCNLVFRLHLHEREGLVELFRRDFWPLMYVLAHHEQDFCDFVSRRLRRIDQGDLFGFKNVLLIRGDDVSSL